MSNSKNQTDWLQWWQSAVEKSMKTNADFLNQAWQQYMDLFKSDTSKAAAPDWTGFLQNYVRYNTQMTDQYMKAYQDWMKNWSDSPSKPEAAQAPSSMERSVSQPLELKLSGSPGEKITVSFSLNNDGVHKQSGLFFQSAFFSYDTGEPVDLDLKISPPAVGILPGQSQQIDLHLALPRTLAAGQYRSQLNIQGFEDASFILLLEVAEKPKKTKSK